MCITARKNKNLPDFQKYVYFRAGFYQEGCCWVVPAPFYALVPPPFPQSWQGLAVSQPWEACQSPPIFRRGSFLFLSGVVSNRMSQGTPGSWPFNPPSLTPGPKEWPRLPTLFLTLEPDSLTA